MFQSNKAMLFLRNMAELAAPIVFSFLFFFRPVILDTFQSMTSPYLRHHDALTYDGSN
jgi:hypothetical protein